tara:strand:- start:799 stop:1026 length:228 start_codon:yes stop_codon:yes gene_type:complete
MRQSDASPSAAFGVDHGALRLAILDDDQPVGGTLALPPSEDSPSPASPSPLDFRIVVAAATPITVTTTDHSARSE